ncbi:MAG: glycosyltransferase family 1 protein [Candidatus Sphingomonas phytovorans]|nr:glycosyltransferase family 1 protein [Sphingomonas sp.]WEK02077.1 MAG: glycosyltransferase family 1 protein [Sphingomonas sp.]
MKLLAYVHLRRIHNATGAGRVVRNIIEQLHLLGRDDIRLLVDRADRQDVIPKVGKPWSDYRYLDFRLDTSWQQAMWIATDRPRAEHWWPEADIVYCTSESYVPTRRAKSIITLHDASYFEPSALPRNAGFARQKAKWQVLYRKLERNADMFHTVSHFSAQRIAHFYPAMRDRLRVVHNGVTERFFQPPNAAGQARLARLGVNDKPFILLSGGLSYRKNAEVALAAWPRLRSMHPDLTLVVPGHCEPEYIEQARAIGASIILAGYVDDDTLCSLYHAARLVWFPSLYEGFGIPVIEAMICGTAVVASAASSIPEVAGDAALLVDPVRAEQHVEALDELLTNDSTRIELVTRGLARGQRFTWAAAAATLRGHLTELA